MLVYAVTTEDGQNRAERNKKTYPKIRSTPNAVQLKLADRIANVEASLSNNPKKLKMYKEEYSEFQLALKTSGVAEPMWNHLELLLEN